MFQQNKQSKKKVQKQQKVLSSLVSKAMQLLMFQCQSMTKSIFWAADILVFLL